MWSQTILSQYKKSNTLPEREGERMKEDEGETLRKGALKNEHGAISKVYFFFFFIPFIHRAKFTLYL